MIVDVVGNLKYATAQACTANMLQTFRHLCFVFVLGGGDDLQSFSSPRLK